MRVRNPKSEIQSPLVRVLALLTVVGSLVGCGGAQTTEIVPTDVVSVVPQGAVRKVVAEAIIEPARWVELRFEDGGMVAEVSVEEGDVVSRGDLLVRLDTTDAEMALQEAEAAIALARAQLARVKARPRPEEVAAAEARLAAAEAALDHAVAQQEELASGSIDAAIAAARAEVAVAEIVQRAAEEAHNDTMECHDVRNENGDKETVCPLLGPMEERARYALEEANAALAAAQVQVAALVGGVEAQLRAAEAEVESASAQRDAAQAQLDLVKAGSTSGEIAVAEAQVAQAEVALAAVKAALERFEIRAPFAGTVSLVNIDIGETAVSGEVILVLATLDQLQVRITDLTELDVARVAQGQSVAVTADALPDRQLRGHVVRIGEQSVDHRGDVTYPVFVELDENTLGFRWGMTVLVEIEAE